MTAKIFTWDYSGQADLAAIAAEVARQSGGRVHMREFDSGGDEYAWIVADHLVGEDEADFLYAGEPGEDAGQTGDEDDRPEPEGRSNDARLARWVKEHVADRAVRAEAAGSLTQPMTGGELWDLLHEVAEHFYWLAVDDVQARYTN